MKTFIYIILSICILSILYLCHKNDRQQNDIVRLSNAIREQNISKKDSLVNLIEQERFKEEFYSTQLSLKSDWIIFYVTVLFSLFGIVGYSFFAERVNSISKVLKSEFETKIEEHKKEYVRQSHELIKIKKDTYLLLAKGYINDGNYNKNTEIGFLSYLLSAHSYFKLIEIEDNEHFCEKYLILLIATLEKSHESLVNIKQNESTLMIKEDFVEIQHKIIEIGKYYNRRVIDLCAMIIIIVNKIGSN